MRVWKWIGIGIGALVLAAFVGLSLLAGGPRNVYGLVRYALPHMHRGTLRIGDDAPDARLVALDGKTRFELREHVGARPLVLIFGSYT